MSAAEQILCTCAAIIIVENITLVLVIILNRPLQNHTNFFVLSMAVSDTLVGAAFIPTYLYGTEGAFTVLLGAVTSMVMFSNVSNIVLVTTDRLLASTKGMSYRLFMNKYYRHMIVTAWLVPTIITFVPFIWNADMNSQYHFVFLVIVQALVFLVYVYIIAVYSYILHLARTVLWKKKKKPTKNITTELATDLSVKRESKLCVPKWTNAECKITKVFSSVCILFCLTWAPMIFLTTCTMLKREDLIFKELPDIAMYLTSFSSIVNPWIYAITKNDFRSLLRKCLGRVYQSFLTACVLDTDPESTTAEARNEEVHRV